MVRFVEKYTVNEDGCWLWTASLDRRGYGQFFDGSTMVKAHRFSLAMAGQTLVQGLHVDHICRVRRCVNPDHLEQVEPAENWRRGAGLGQQLWTPPPTCSQGHPRTPENTKKTKRGPTCRLCFNEKARRRYASRVGGPEVDAA
jgi:hypothetical protein